MKRRRYRLSKTARRVLALGCGGFIAKLAMHGRASWWHSLDAMDLTMASLERNGLLRRSDALYGWIVTPAGRRALARGWR